MGKHHLVNKVRRCQSLVLLFLTLTLVDTVNLTRTGSSSTAAEMDQVINATEGDEGLLVS